MTVTIVVGGFFGDEGKGKIISYLAIKDKPKIIVRGGAGPNAGHTVTDGNRTYKIRMLPSGFLNRESEVMIGPGVVIDPEILKEEINNFDAADQVFIDKNCGVINETHKSIDLKGELNVKIGSTGSGTGPANADRAMRKLVLAKDIESLKSIITDVPARLNAAIIDDSNVLVEGTQGTFLSLWHGTYPFVTSKDVTAAGICADVGLGPTKIDQVIIVFKAYVTRVGEGPLDNEITVEKAKSRGWSEFGTVTGRPRRAADFDYNLAKRAIMLNGATQIAITKIDVLFTDCAGKQKFEELSADAQSFINNIELNLNVPVTIIGTGPNIDDVIDRRD